MTGVESTLGEAELAHWHAHGYVPPVRVMPAAAMAAHVAAFERQHDGGPAMNRHCDLPALQAICRDVDVWGRIGSLLGPDLLLWRTNLFLGQPSLQWHEDQHARLLNGGFGLSALVALTDGSDDNCTLLAPGSHALDPEAKARRYGLSADPRAGGNIRYQGQLDPADFIRMPLRAGECLIFHPQLLHASSGSLGTDTQSRRMNLVLRVTPADTRVSDAAYADAAGGARCGPVLMRGTLRDPRGAG